jgi:predicted amidohydrolase
MTIAAVVQMNSAADVATNLSAARVLLERAAKQGARIAALPENFAIMGAREADKLAVAEDDGSGPIQTWLSNTARELNLWIVGGTIPLRTQEAERVSAACCVYDADGKRAARYDKMHLFDVDARAADASGKAERYRESASIAPGERIVVVDSPIGRLGLSVCYDLRFPELFRAMQVQGAEVFSIPAAFTVPTGEAHWDVLMRARAIENLSYVLAPAQVGRHASGRETYGNSLIADPWGVVVARVSGNEPGVACAPIDLNSQREIRERFPALAHRRVLV